jgi:hypothetical protein
MDSKRLSCADATRLVSSLVVAVTIILATCPVYHCHTRHMRVSFYAGQSVVHKLSGGSDSRTHIRTARAGQRLSCVYIHSQRIALTSAILFPLSGINNLIYLGLPQPDHFISPCIASSLQSRAPPQCMLLC